MAVTNYHWDVRSDSYLQETDGANTTKATYTNDSAGKLISQYRSDETSHYHYDGLGSASALTDDDETVTDTYTYSAFGNVVASTGATENPFRWVGEVGYYFDEALGNYYVRARTYQPRTATWLSLDPIKFIVVTVRDGLTSKETQNWKPLLTPYTYVMSNPLNFVDPSGLDFIAVADRRVSMSLGAGYHYSAEQWRCCKKFTPLHFAKGFTRNEIIKKCTCPGQKEEPEKLHAVELLARTGWIVWATRPKLFGGGREWVLKSVWIAEIVYSDSATKVMPIFDGKPTAVANKWRLLREAAKKYKYAEQEGFGGAFRNWPRSMYKTFQTNSNTFIKHIINSAGLPWTDMAGNHPGNSAPSQNTDDAVTGGELHFFENHTPWDDHKGPDKPMPNEPPT